LVEAGVHATFIVLSATLPEHSAFCVAYGLEPVVCTLDMVESLACAAARADTRIAVHLKVDTGMGRLGVRMDKLAEFLSGLKKFQNVRIDGVMTHFAAADDDACEPLTNVQIRRFHEAVAMFREHGYNPTYLHLANSAGIYSHPEAWGNLVRPGGVLYGL